MFRKFLGLVPRQLQWGESASDSTQALSLNANPRSEVDQTSIKVEDAQLGAEALRQPVTPGFFSGATRTVISGPAQLATTSGNLLAVHIHQPSAVSMNTSDVPLAGSTQPLMHGPPTSTPTQPLNTANLASPSNCKMGNPDPTESIDSNPLKDNEIYAQLLQPKERGYALYVPEPNRRLPFAYRKVGVSIGDVGFITADGGFSFLFNICSPANDPINPSILPEGFSPLRPPLTEMDIAEYSPLKSGSYLASALIEIKENESNTRGLHFETSASKGAVLTIPEGAISLDLQNKIAFSNYLDANLRKWYEFVYRVRGKSIGNGELRLVIGCDKASAWGIATVSGRSRHSLKFKALNASGSSATTYTWECSGMVEVRVGPDEHDIEALRSDDPGDHPLSSTLRNQCLFVRTMNPGFSKVDWKKLMKNIGKSMVEDHNNHSRMESHPPQQSRPSGSGSNTESSNQPGSHQGTSGTQFCAMGMEDEITISTMPESSVPYHPSNELNRQLLLKFPDCKMVITTDHDWISALPEDEEMVLDPESLLERVLASRDVSIEQGVLRLYEPRSFPNNAVGDGDFVSKDTVMNQLNVERRGKVQALLGLEVETENEILKNTPPAEEAIRQIPRLFALIIGINVYQMNHRTLRGAVPDGKAFKRYLMERLCVPENQIITLFDRDATRTAIIENGFRKLRDNEDIKEGDPIFIFYAGHGSQKYAHPDWELNGRNVQMEVILPYDCGVVNEEHPEGVEPIPDRTIGILIDEIAAEKGDNITVVFDTCHSASGTRSQDENSLTIVRSVQLEDVPFRKETDRAIWARSARLDAAQSRRGLESHMLISACKSSEDAIEYKGRGKFSTALLKLLESTSPDKLRYRDILANMESISPQNPQCEGLSQDRLLFNGKVLPPGQVYPIREDTSEFALEASAAHAIALNAEYMPYSDPDKSLKPLPSPRPMFMQGTVEQTPSHVIKEAEFWSMIPSPLRPLKRRREFNEEERRNVRRVAPHHPNYEAQRSRNAEFSSLPPKRSLSPQYYWVPPLTPSPHSTPYYPPPPIEGYQFRHFSPTPEILNCDDINGGPRAQHYEHRRPALPSQRPGYPSSQYRRTQSQSHARPPSPPPSALYRRVSLKPRPSAQHRRVLSQPRSERPPLHLQVVMGASEPGDGYEVHLHGQGRKERAANGGGGEDIVRNDERDASDAAASEDDDDDESIDSSADPEFEPDTFAAW